MNEPLTKAQREAILETKQPRAYIRENIARYEATVQDLENQLANEKQGHRIMDAAYWAQTAALGALARVLDILNDKHHQCPFCKSRGSLHRKGCELVVALAPDFVQRAAEASKAKDAEIERLRFDLKQTDEANGRLKQLLREAQFATLDTASDAETRLVNRLQVAEAKLAVAMELRELEEMGWSFSWNSANKPAWHAFKEYRGIVADAPEELLDKIMAEEKKHG